MSCRIMQVETSAGCHRVSISHCRHKSKTTNCRMESQAERDLLLKSFTICRDTLYCARSLQHVDDVVLCIALVQPCSLLFELSQPIPWITNVCQTLSEWENPWNISASRKPYVCNQGFNFTHTDQGETLSRQFLKALAFRGFVDRLSNGKIRLLGKNSLTPTGWATHDAISLL